MSIREEMEELRHPRDKAARDELESPFAELEERPYINTQVKAWHAAEDEILASEMGDPDNPFTTPDEDDVWKQMAEKELSKYHVLINGKLTDVYDILVAYRITNPADQHALKKMLKPGQRGSKDGIQDRREAIVSLQRAIELECGE